MDEIIYKNDTALLLRRRMMIANTFYPDKNLIAVYCEKDSNLTKVFYSTDGFETYIEENTNRIINFNTNIYSSPTCGHDKYYLADVRDCMYTSTDLVNWNYVSNSSLNIPADNTISLVYGNGVYVLVCRYCIYVSSDYMQTWTQLTLYDEESNGYTQLIYENGMFILNGGYTGIYTSYDGYTWTHSNIPSNCSWLHVFHMKKIMDFTVFGNPVLLIKDTCTLQKILQHIQ